MSREYSRVAPEFWTGRTGKAIRALGCECQVLALYLLTSPHSTAIGLYSLPLAYVSADTGLTIEGASKALLSLRDVGFCEYDPALEVVWVPEMARFQIGEVLKPNDKRGTWIASTASKFRKHGFYRLFVSKYRAPFALRIVAEDAPSDINPPSPLEGASKPLRCQEQDQEQEQEQEQAAARRGGEARPVVGTKPRWLAHAEGPDPLTVRCLEAFDAGYASASRGGNPLGVRNRHADLGALVEDAKAFGDPIDVFRRAGASVARRVAESKKSEYPISHPWRAFCAAPIGSWLDDADCSAPSAPSRRSEAESRVKAAETAYRAGLGEEGTTARKAALDAARADLARVQVQS
jgi:hypothetical protein